MVPTHKKKQQKIGLPSRVNEPAVNLIIGQDNHDTPRLK